MDELDNADRVRMLSVIDQFRAFGISKDISLPQVSPSSLIRLVIRMLTVVPAGRRR